MVQTKTLLRQRQATRAKVQSIFDQTTNISAGDFDITTVSKIEIASDLKKLQSYQKKFEELDVQILDKLAAKHSDSDIEAEADDASAFIDQIVTLTSKLDSILTELNSNFSHQNSNASTKLDTKTNADPHTTTQSAAKLSKLQINQFTGDALQWQEFWDVFESTIHTRSDLSAIDKLKYLKNYLGGEALRVVEGYRLTAPNYEVVLGGLRERFGNPEVAVFSHFEKLLALSPEREPSKLQIIYDECEKHIRSLVALGLSEDAFGKVFTPIILSKIPRPIRIQLHRSNGSKTWELSSLRELMKEELKAQELSDRYSPPQTSQGKVQSQGSPGASANQAKNYKGFRGSNSYPTQGALLKQSGPNPKVASAVCSFCSGPHFSDQCQKYKTGTERKAQVGNRCLKCLQTGHAMKECRSTKLCFYCKKNGHHSSLCYQKFGGPKGDRVSHNEQKVSSSVPPATASHASYSSGTNSGSAASALLLQGGHKVQMQMAVVSFPHSNTNARIFFDTGCSRSYITREAAQRIGVISCGREVLLSSKFGDKSRRTEKYDVGNLEIPLSDGSSVHIIVLITDHITCPINKYPMDVSQHPILSQVCLADPPSPSIQVVGIDILIGSDHFHDLVGSEKVTLSNGMYLINSKLGYILTGKVPHCDEFSTQSMAVTLLRQSTPSNESAFEQLWSLDTIGIKDNPYSLDDDVALTQFNNSIRRVDKGRYEVGWPWKDPVPELPTNYGLALACLRSLQVRLSKNSSMLTEYDNVIKSQEKTGIIERVDHNIAASEKVHYLPHHAVMRPDKATTKSELSSMPQLKVRKIRLALTNVFTEDP